jgi:transposase-like protein
MNVICPKCGSRNFVENNGTLLGWLHCKKCNSQLGEFVSPRNLV